jgi:cytosine deaminase
MGCLSLKCSMAAAPFDPALMDVALEEARLGLAEGGLPIGAVIARLDGTVLGRGHNRRVQDGDPTCHGETDAARKAGRHDFSGAVLYTTLSPCAYCVELVLLLRIPTVVIGESRTFPGMPDRLRRAGVEVVDLDDARCVAMMERFIEEHPELWNEDIGVAEGGSAAYARS